MSPKGWLAQSDLDELHRAVEAAEAAGVDAKRLEPAQVMMDRWVAGV